MSDLLREVDDAVRADNMKRLWDEHKNIIITFVAALIVGTAAMSAWTSYQLAQHRKASGEILTALDSSAPAENLTTIAKNQKGNSQAIAYLNAASLDLKAGNKLKALDAYSAAQSAKFADGLLHDLATLQKVNLLIDLKPDTKSADLLKELEPIAKNKNSPWAGEAVFATAFIKGEKDKDYAGAVAELKSLQARDDVTDSIKQRAQALQSVYDLKLQEKK